MGDPALAVIQILVHVVGDDYPALFIRHAAHRLERGAGVHGATRVRGAVEDDDSGPLGHVAGQRVRIEVELIFFLQRHDHRRAAGKLHHGRIGDPVRGGDEHLVARVEQRLENIVEAVLAATAHLHLAGLVLPALFRAELVADRPAQFGNAGHRGVAGVTIVDGLLAGRADVGRCGQVRFADAEVENIGAGGAQLLGLGVDGKGRRGWNLQNPVRENDGFRRHQGAPSGRTVSGQKNSALYCFWRFFTSAKQRYGVIRKRRRR